MWVDCCYRIPTWKEHHLQRHEAWKCFDWRRWTSETHWFRSFKIDQGWLLQLEWILWLSRISCAWDAREPSSWQEYWLVWYRDNPLRVPCWPTSLLQPRPGHFVRKHPRSSSNSASLYRLRLLRPVEALALAQPPRPYWGSRGHLRNKRPHLVQGRVLGRRLS